MVRKRKRKGVDRNDGQKRPKLQRTLNGTEMVIKQALLDQYYPKVSSLRDYLLSRLPRTSKIRRKKIQSIGRSPSNESEQQLSVFLDNTLIGLSKYEEVSSEERWRQWATFSQKADDSISFANLSGPGMFCQSEIVDFSIWQLFSKKRAPSGKNQHLLCQGFRKDVTAHAVSRGMPATSSIPGVVSVYPNSHVTSMKTWPWPQILGLMGKEGEKGMVDLILDCGIFTAVGTGRGTYHQLSGQPLGDTQVLPGIEPLDATGNPIVQRALRSPSNINFVRNRMLYARAALNARGSVRFGLRHIHVLNRYPLVGPSESEEKYVPDSLTYADRSTIHVMMYIFPRQFGLHNVFTNDVDPRQTVQPFKDYTMREDEISQIYSVPDAVKIPKRLRGHTVQLVRKLQVHHSRCPYKELLDYYCPVSRQGSVDRTAVLESQHSIEPSSRLKTQLSPMTAPKSVNMTTSIEIPPPKISMMDHATPIAMVSAFCRAVLKRVIPLDFWGCGESGTENQRIFHRNVDKFIELRRFENLSLHEVSQGLKISDISWLGPPNTQRNKLSQSDTGKRWEIFYEFLYYLFDSILIPLIRANFHVTESNVHRYRLFYFRHDTWRLLAEPALVSLKATMFEEIRLEQARKVLNARSLGYSQVRLLPKETGVRPIMNLRRRSAKKVYNNTILGSSINAVLAPVYNILTLEKASNPSRLGSTLFSVGDLYTKLKAFKISVLSSAKPLYFAKLDVQAAFDTIPQHAVLQLISSIPSESEYRISKHVEIKPGDNYRQDLKAKPMRKWAAQAFKPDDFSNFGENIQTKLSIGKKNTIFVENIVQQFRDKDEILSLLTEHIQRNMVKIGNKFYRQKEGIPQGSVLSSILCNYFYADLEARHLGFLQSDESLLLRLIDDFLLITTNHGHARKFLQTMHDGVPEYGVKVNANKTLVNFEATINGKKIARLLGKGDFPYCGSFINTKTLDISKDRERRKDMAIVDSLTVEYSGVPGKTFHRKVLNTFKIQSHAMFLDTSFNAFSTVLSNIYTSFIETATKMWTYIKCLPTGKQPGTRLLTKTITDLIELAYVLMKSKGKNGKNTGYQCALSKIQVEWLAVNAFREVLVKRQTKYRKILEWIGERIDRLRARDAETCDRMKGIIIRN